MKIVILLRYPEVEKSAWKRALVTKLVLAGYQVSVVFGDSSYLAHLKAALNQFGWNFWAKHQKSGAASGPKFVKYFKNKLDIFRVGDLNSPQSEALLKRLQPEVILLLGTGIIRKNILVIPKIGNVHCHQGFLPKYRGVNTIEWSIFHHDDVYISTHFVSPGIDTGDILLQKKIDLDGLKDIPAVRDKCHDTAVDLIFDTINAIQDGTLQPISQQKEDGRQYFTMHPFFLDLVHGKLAGYALSK